MSNGNDSDELLIGDIVRFKKEWRCDTGDLEGIIINDDAQLKLKGFYSRTNLCGVEGNGFSMWVDCDKLIKVKK